MCLMLPYFAYRFSFLGASEVVPAVCAVFLFFLVVPYGFFLSPYIEARKHLRNDPRLQRPTIYTFSPEGITVQSDFRESTVGWATLAEVLETKRHFFLYPRMEATLVLPKRCFVGAWNIKAFRDLLREMVPEAKLLRE